jgi:hypothetical protein
MTPSKITYSFEIICAVVAIPLVVFMLKVVMPEMLRLV